MDKRSRRGVGAVVVLSVVLQTGCGTIMYPSRRGQIGGRIDAGVAVLDAVGLLFFILPGVIAFAVDFSQGTIYYPGGPRAPVTRNGLKTIRFDPRRDGPKDIERLIRENTGIAVALDQRGMQAFELNSADELPARFTAAGTFASR
jgi:hypothetical protein